MRHKIDKYLSVALMICLIVGGVLFNACSKDDDNDAQVQVTIFGPSPALRGGVIKFVGTNMDKVTSVVFPNNVEVKDITKNGSTEISVTVPQDANPGLLVLKTPNGDIKTKTAISYIEPISIDDYTKSAVKVGDLFTIKGDYLNLIAKVIFADGAVVDSAHFVSKSRKQIEVKVPKAAKSGKVIVATGAEIPVMVYTSGEANISNPVTLTAIAPSPVKPGSSLKIAGTYLNLIKSVIIPDGNKIDSADIQINTANTEITVKVPATAKEGVIKAITYSGIEMNISQALSLVAPSVSSLASSTVKNGATLSIVGTDLDLVTEVVFEGGAKGTISSQSPTSLEVTIPLTAKDGQVTLNTNSGKSAKTAAITMTKPTFTSINPLSVTAGDKVTISGTDLDLVRKVIFLGGTVAVQPSTGENSIEVIIPTTCVGSDFVVFETVNGTQVSSSDQLEIKASTMPAITKITSVVKPGALLVIEGKNLNYVESITFDTNVKAVLYGVRTESKIEVYVPETAKKGSVTLTMKAFDGTPITSPEFTVSGTDPVVDPSYIFFDFDNKGSWWGSYGAVENNPDLSLNGKYFRINQNLPSGWVDFFWRNGQDNMKVAGVTVAQWAVKMDVNVLGGTTPAFKFRLNGTDGDFWAIVPGLENKGDWYTVTIPLTSFKDGDGYGTNTLPNVQNITKDFGLATAGDAGFVNMCIDNVRFEPLSAPSSVFGLY